MADHFIPIATSTQTTSCGQGSSRSSSGSIGMARGPPSSLPPPSPLSLTLSLLRPGDHNCDVDEFGDYLESRGTPVNRPALVQRFEEYDTNGNGTCDPDELVGVIRAMGLLDIVPGAEETAMFEMQWRSKIMRDRRQKNPAVYNNPVWDKEFDLGVTISDEDIDRFKVCYSMADIEHLGFLGRRQFLDLLKLIGQDAVLEEPELIDNMFQEMDEDGDGQIEFPEFVRAMVNHIGMDTLEEIAEIELGSQGTRKWSRGEIHWSANTGMILISIGVVIAGLSYFSYILVPLMLAYFLTFLVSPIMNLLEHRPLKNGKCDPGYEPDPVSFCGAVRSHRAAVAVLTPGRVCVLQDNKGQLRSIDPARREAELTGEGLLVMNLKLGALPHGVAVLGTVVIFFAAFAVLILLVVNEVSALLADQQFVVELDAFKESIYETLNESGIKVVRDLDPRYTAAELNSYFDMMMAVFNAFALQLLLTLYIMFEKVDVNMFTGQTMCEIEKQVTGYISLKTGLSFLTGAVVAVILVLLGVKLAVMFGVLSFVLNYIPNVGSMIAMFLPMPIVIVDKNLAQWQKIGAFVGPGVVQGYVGNALEPMMFGKSLNMTPMSILAALVIWGSVWGIIGAILSVPMLAIQKILLMKANHPLAKYALKMIREDASIDENDPDGAEARKLRGAVLVTELSMHPHAGKGTSRMPGREMDVMDNPLSGAPGSVIAQDGDVDDV